MAIASNSNGSESAASTDAETRRALASQHRQRGEQWAREHKVMLRVIFWSIGVALAAGYVLLHGV